MSSVRKPLSTVLFSIALFVPLNEMAAQTTASGGIAGVVSDPSGAVMPNAIVELKDPTKGTHEREETDHDGIYRFFFVPPGQYVLTVTHPQFQTDIRTVTIALGPTTTVNVSLKLESQRSSIVVTTDASLLRAENGDVSATITQKEISELPNPGNDLTYIAQTAPGAVMNTDIQGGANFSILGMPGFSYLHTIDGMNDNDNGVNLSQIGALILLLGQNQVQESTVVTTGYSGQFGGAAGGNINYITKSGSDAFHGNAQYYWNGRALNANDWFLNAFGNPRPFSIANQWAASIGGPIKKDALFFFFDTEGLRISIPQNALVTIPSPEFETATIANIDSDPRLGPATDAFYGKMFALYNAAPGKTPTAPGAGPIDPLGCSGFADVGSGLGISVPCSRYFFASRSRPSQDALVSGRFDWNVDTNDRVFLRVQYDHGRGASGTDLISPIFDTDFTQPWWQAQLQETHTFSASAANQFLVAGSYFAGIFQLKNASQALAAFPTTLNFVDGPYTNLGGAGNFTAFGFGRYNTQYQLSDDFATTLKRHRLGFGAQLGLTYWSELPRKSATIGHLDVQSLRAFFEGGVDPDSPAVDFTTLTQSFTSQNKLPISFLNFALYANDEWRARSNLVLTLALRAEHYSNPSCESRCFARLVKPFDELNHDPNLPYDQAILIDQKHPFNAIDTILWSPRLSVAWQPFGASRSTVIRGGVGVFYDPVPGGILDSFSGNSPLLNTFTVVGGNIAPDESTSLFKTAATSNTAFTQGFATGQTLEQIQAAAPDFVPPAINDSTRHTHSPEYQRWSVEWQHGFGPDTSFSVGYFGHHGIYGLLQNPNANAFGFGSLPVGRCGEPVPACAPDPKFSGVTEVLTNAVSSYHGMVVSFQRRFGGRSQSLFQVNYTYGHALDEVSSNGNFIFSNATLTFAQDPGNPRGSYGSADHDVRHSLNAKYVWEVPLQTVFSRHMPDKLVSGWQVSGTIFARSGFPYTVIDFEQSSSLVSNNYFSLLYAVPVNALRGDPSCGKGAAISSPSQPCQTPQVLQDGSTPNPKARFIQSGCATGFNKGYLPAASGPCDGPEVSFAQGRNRFRGPSYFNTDFTIIKNTKLPRWENASLGIGAQFFNFLNHANFGFPDFGISSPTFGQVFSLEQPPTSILGSGFGGDAAPRMIQLKMQLTF